MQALASRRAALATAAALLARAALPLRASGFAKASALAGLGLAPGLRVHAADAVDASAPPAEVSAALPGARLLGSGRLRFLGLAIYDSRLWAPSGFAAASYAQRPFALELNYLRSLSGKLIAERSLKEMRRQGSLSAQQEQAWLQAMLQAFPDVNAGDRITGVHTPGTGARFWFNGQLRASIPDADFSRVFFGIWLSEATSEPQLRLGLLGQAA
ncbi:MAG: chalcone isomerase family protein [Rhodoferax sp.]|nr:chalcone isomerase family protein [Rhodoferax sp.]